MRRLCFGGSFNPIHVGHVLCARFAAEAAGFEGVRLIPSAANPHKPDAKLASAELRLSMLQAAVGSDPFFLIDPIETRRGGVSYTYDTASSLIDAGDTPPITWLIGADLLQNLHTWHRFDELMRIVAFLVMRRPGQPVALDRCDPGIRSAVAQIVEVPQIEISSTLVRRRVEQGRSISGLVHPAVQKIIESNGLYSK